MNPKETDDLTEFIRQIRDEFQLSIFMIEHHMQVVMGISDRICVFDYGRPKLLMMDEPSLGLAPLIVKDIFNIIREIHSQGMTILLIEQNANAALHIADVGYVIETGRITLKGTGKELLANEDVKKAYLGESVIKLKA